MKMLRVWVVVVGMSLLGSVALWGGCSPVGLPSDQDSGSGTEKGSGHSTEHTSQKDGSTHSEPAVEKPGQDDTAPDSPSAEKPASESTTPDERTSDDATHTDDTGSKDATPRDTSAQDDDSEQGTPDDASQDQASAENQTPLCETKGGYCDQGVGPCRTGYQNAGDPMGCAGGRSALCCLPQKPQCVSDKDCPPTCRGSGVCTQTLYQCVNGACQSTGTGSQPNAKCDANTGQCVPLTPGCQTDCDCAQGLLCANGQCLAGTKPAYCCDKPGCPEGQDCTDKAGAKGTCPKSTTDCDKKGGYCTPQNTKCKAGYQLDTNVHCGNVRSLLCCMPTTNKCAAVLCQPPVCSMNSGVCFQTSHTCDPATGKCVPSIKKIASACTMGGANCIQQTPGCSSGQCVVKSSTFQPACRQSGTSCIESIPACSNNSCTFTQKTYSLSQCSSTGQCVATKPQCKVNCDCLQGQLCANGQCVTGIVPAYCCDKAGCPAGQTCTDKSGNKGTCQTTTDCAKKGGYCTVQFTQCKAGYKLDTNVSCGPVRALQCCLPTVNKCATVKCQGPQCLMNSVGGCSQISYTCDPGSGQCVAATKSANASCSMSGTSCVQSTPACVNNQCSTSSKTIQATCQQSGSNCIQTIPLCSSNRCSTTTRTLANSKCNTSTGQCSVTGITCQKANGTCVKSGQSCPRGSTPISALACPSRGETCCVKLSAP